MSVLPDPTTLALDPMKPAAAVINHLLAQEPWARSTLMAHAGKVACIDTGVMPLRLKVSGDGYLQEVPADAPANVTIRLKLSDLPLIAANRERAVSYVKLEGDADFANAISQLSQKLRWDAEDDLSRVVGDVAATRIVAGARELFDAARNTGRKLSENLAEYFLEEQPMLIRPRQLQDFSADVVRLRDDLERLSKRIEKLERR
ncbi:MULTISPECIES: ubiquinone biosynthesis accessory factor UbiJ [Herbaspirillum]|jgi:ubiquinone biosynthesis protein UbiJ|uniref:Ubiquinone biosynthesis accessory factor UbiJ n=2 Tax=Herbaspirillum rubrisubalbicans TaxID=80842 RepID=A0A6M3ZW45_9BURK|nr:MULTISPECIES: SCP2 sterol-binding domain-containing protein [Herbaspirillum]MCP1574407.1 ubiquinone biosynthesis protein UbiJ [Herbaspirillum rubrisubalbicans]QJQ02885.1 sterol-binding protein [Herbaspirillum rubrisubalbicans Os34]